MKDILLSIFIGTPIFTYLLILFWPLIMSILVVAVATLPVTIPILILGYLFEKDRLRSRSNISKLR